MDPVFYGETIEVASASGVWITTADGRRYLDGHNNAPCVGHARPRVTAAIARQARSINTRRITTSDKITSPYCDCL